MLRKLLLLLGVAVLLAIVSAAAGFWQQHKALTQPLNLEQALLLDVPAGATPTGMLNRLEANGVIEGAFWLRLYWRFVMDAPSLHSGEYRLLPTYTAQQMLELWQRAEVVQRSLTLVEGWNFRQLRAALARQELLEQRLSDLSDEALMAHLGLEGQHPEGRFFPDTYQFTRGMSDEDILRQANARLEAVLAQEWEQRAEGLPYREPYEALIMASIIEKETGVPHERSEIAGVFVRRLRLGMRLQTDPTVIYGMGERYNGRITRTDLRQPTPYNTYTISGLPPTPIAMVGREAIHAALHPKDGKSLYFVAKGDGSHVFSNTLDAHNRAVREYQLKRRADYRSSPAPRAAETP